MEVAHDFLRSSRALSPALYLEQPLDEELLEHSLCKATGGDVLPVEEETIGLE